MIITARGTIALAAVVAVAVTPSAAGAESSDANLDEHCVLHITGVEKSGRLITDVPACYPTLAEALRDARGGTDSAGEPNLDSSDGGSAAMSTSGVIGVHWEGSNRTGSSITISGADCGGGYVNLSNDWTNRIRSTRNYCPSVRFFDGFDKSGSSEPTTGSTVNLSSLSAASNSISYSS